MVKMFMNGLAQPRLEDLVRPSLSSKFPFLVACVLLVGLLLATFSTLKSALCRPKLGDSSASRQPLVLHAGGTTISVQINPERYQLPQQTILKWIERSANGVSRYFGKFPVSSLHIVVIDEPGHGMSFGEAKPLDEAQINMWLGTETNEADLKKEWTLVHEMVHLGFPFTDDDANWATEGLATYVEPIVRAQIGDLPKEELWNDLRKGLPQGLPTASDKGLSITHSWGSTYWGGALFYLLADVEIRRETKNKKGLPDALRAINQQGGNIFEDWDMPKTFAIGDRGTGTKVLTKLYQRMALHRESADLDGLWKELGVKVQNGHVLLDASAPLGTVREAIEAGHAS